MTDESWVVELSREGELAFAQKLAESLVIDHVGPDACTLCLGWKRVDDGADGISWKFWAELPAPQAIAVKMGLVKPIVCPRCGGTGIEPTGVVQ